MHKLSFIEPALSEAPATSIPGAIARTEQAIAALHDSDLLERIAVVCLRDFEPTLRQSGGPGDEQRDGVGGSLKVDSDELVVTASLEKTWSKKIERDLDGLAAHGHKPRMVWAVTSHLRPGAQRRTELENGAQERWGHALKIIDGRFLARRLLSPELLSVREELLGLPPPTFPLTQDAASFSEGLTSLGAPEELIGRDEDLEHLVHMLSKSHCVQLIGVGGVGKSRLALAAAARINTGRVRFIDATTPLDSDRLHAELAGTNALLLVVDNAHRRDDLGGLLAVLLRRKGTARLLLIARPGYDARLRDALADTPFAQLDAASRIELAAMSNAAIGALVRAAQPTLHFSGAVEQIVALAEGNPQIGLIAHRVAVDRGGLSGLSRGEVLESYVATAVDGLAAGRADVDTDDLRDCLGMAALFGRVGPDEEALLAQLLGLSRRQVRHRLGDLADFGLVRDEGEASVVAPDLLAAHLLRDMFFGARRPPVSFREAWTAASAVQRGRICAALGGLEGFTVEDRHQIADFLRAELRELAGSEPAEALRWAQSLAPGLPQVALACVDAVFDVVAGEDALGLCPTAMAVCARVPDFELGWPHQLAIARTFYAHRQTNDEDTEIQEGLTHVYQRLPIDTSRHDAQILAHVQELLMVLTSAWAEEHRHTVGADETLALAARQMLTVQFETSYLSPEDEMKLQMRAAFLPGGERTERVLQLGVELLASALPALPTPRQVLALAPLHSLRRYAAGALGPWGARPDARLPRTCERALMGATGALATLRELPVSTKSAAVDAVGSNPWPADDELAAYRDLFVTDHADPAEVEKQPQRAAQGLVAAADLGGVLRRWRLWLHEADLADQGHNGYYVIGEALRLAAEEDPDRLRAALGDELSQADGLGTLCNGALSVLFVATGARELAGELLSQAPAVARAAVALGLSSTAASWADNVLKNLAADPDRDVRRAVARTVGWGQPPSGERLAAGLTACLPDDAWALSNVLTGLARREQTIPLDPYALHCVRAVLMGVAAIARPDGRVVQHIVELCAAPRLAMEFLLTRLDWLETQPEDLQALLRRDGLPEDLRELARKNARPADIEHLCERLERGDGGPSVHQGVIDLLSWIDTGPALSDRIAVWLSDENEELAKAAKKLLRETRDPALFRARVERILATGPALDITEAVLDAREPIWMVGSEKAIMLARAAEFEPWTHANDPCIAAIGRAGYERYSERARLARGEEVDPNAQAG